MLRKSSKYFLSMVSLRFKRKEKVLSVDIKVKFRSIFGCREVLDLKLGGSGFRIIFSGMLLCSFLSFSFSK